jgi:uncharacterized protein (DUF1697 family)
METLRELLESLGYRNVRSYIQSGNIVLDSETEPGAEIGDQVQKRAGFRPQVLVLEERAFLEAAETNPWPGAEGKKIHLWFSGDTPNPDFDRIERLRADSEEFHLAGNVCYLHAPEGIGRSRLAAKLEACLGVPVTARNLNTVEAIRRLLQN